MDWVCRSIELLLGAHVVYPRGHLLTAASPPCGPLPVSRTLVQEGHVAKVRVYGPEKRAAMVSLKASAPGGERVAKVGAAAASWLFWGPVACPAFPRFEPIP